jgi:hypothetical protein
MACHLYQYADVLRVVDTRIFSQRNVGIAGAMKSLHLVGTSLSFS